MKICCVGVGVGVKPPAPPAPPATTFVIVGFGVGVGGRHVLWLIMASPLAVVFGVGVAEEDGLPTATPPALPPIVEF